MNNFLLMLGAVFAGILAALAAVPLIVDWNGYRGTLEEEASRLLGRDVRVGGGVALRILPVPYVQFEKLRIADPATTSGDPLFRAENVTMRLSIAPLLRGVLEAQSVVLKKPSLRLAVDANGRGNWATLALQPGALPFMPADVTLKSVDIEGGTLLLVNGAGRDLAQIQGIDGELSADAFDGPYRFKGNVLWGGAAREVRFATSPPEANGAVKLRASVRVPANQNTYQFDGKLTDLKGQVAAEGDLSAKLPIAGAEPAAKSADAGGDAFELKSKVSAGIKGGKLSELVFSLDRPADPQLITGDASAQWDGNLRVDAALVTRSLNLDAIAGAGASKDPLQTARNALSVILGALPSEAQTDAQLKADRVTLAGESITNVMVAMGRQDTDLRVKELRAVLPGATRFDAQGSIRREASAGAAATGAQPLSFSGPVSLHGANLARFLTWAKGAPLGQGAPSEPAPAGFDGPFALDAQLVMSGNSVALTQAVAEIGGKPILGDIRYANEGRPRIEVTLQGARLDAGVLWPGGLDTTKLRALLTGPSGPGDAPAAGAVTGLLGLNPDTADLKADIRAQEFQVNPTTLLRDVTALFSLERGSLTVSRVKFELPSGASLDADGTLSGLSLAAKPAAPRRGLVHFVAGAPDAAALSDALDLTGLPANERPGTDVIAALGPVRMAGSVAAGDRNDGKSADISFDGSINGGRVAGTAKLDQGLAAWRTSAIDASARIETPVLSRWLGFAGLPAAPAGSALAKAGQISLSAKGLPQTGMTALVSLTSEDISAAYQGLVALPKDAPRVVDGAAGIIARDGADVLALAELPLGTGPTGALLKGQVEIKSRGTGLALSFAGFNAGGTTVSGTATLTPGTGPAGSPPQTTVTADLAADQVSLPGLMGVVSDRRTDVAAGGGVQSIWSDKPITFGGLDRVQGSIALSVARLSLDGVTALTDAKAKIGLSPAGITVSDLTGSALSGTLSARAKLDKVAGGGRFTGEGVLTGASLGPDFPLSITGSLSGNGLSASAIVANLSGSGEAMVNASHVKGVAPAGLAPLVEAALADKAPLNGEPLADAVRDGLAASSLTLDARKIPFAVTGGVARTPLTTLSAPQGKVSLETVFDLSAGRYQSDWKIETAAKPGVTGKPKAPLPPVVVTVAGSLAALAEADRKIALTAFEQELGLRKLERDAEELERLRKLDEERRAKEAADSAAAEAAAAAAANAAAAPAPADAEAGNAPPPPAAPADPTAPDATQAPSAPAQTAAPREISPPAPVPARRRRVQEGIPQPFSNF